MDLNLMMKSAALAQRASRRLRRGHKLRTDPCND
jgi:hypothetical protein